VIACVREHRARALAFERLVYDFQRGCLSWYDCAAAVVIG
jgi:hypothetical protein